MTHDMPQMKVLMATGGEARRLEITLNSLAECELPNQLHEILIVENGAVPWNRDRIQQFTNRLPIRYEFVGKPGKSRALNIGIKGFDDTDFVVMTDDDVTFERGWLIAYASCLDHPSGSFYGGPSTSEFESTPEDWLMAFLPASAKGSDPQQRSASKTQTMFMGFNWAAWVGDIKSCGNFDEQIGPGSELCSVGDETDIQLRMLQNGCKPVPIDDAVVCHYVPESKCTEDWIVNRSRQIGRAQGYLSARNGEPQGQGRPQRLKQRVKLEQDLLFSGSDPKRRLRLRCKRQRMIGWQEGWRFGKSNPGLVLAG